MTPPTSRFPRFFAELKRRRVFRVMTVYGAVSFVVLQVADLAFEPLGLPDWALTFVLVLAFLGFPIAIVLAWAFELTPEGVRMSNPASVEEIEAIVAQPASKRWPSGLLALAGAVALASAAWWAGRQTAPVGGVADASADTESRPGIFEAEDDSRPSIAVLPFLDLSPEGNQGYFSDGMTEEILNTLVKIRDIKVAARTSAFAFKGSDLTAQQLGDTLRVRYLVEGSVRKAGEQLRITAQLIDADEGGHLWSGQYDRSLDDVFTIQTEIAEAIAGELRVPLGLEGDDQLVSPTEDLEAYDTYLAARARMKERGASLADAVSLFEAAIARDSTWAPAWAGLAEALEVIGWTSNADAWEEVPTDPDEVGAITDGFWTRSEQAARHALELDPSNASAHVALGSIQRNRGQWDASEEAYLQALATDPDNPEAHQQYSQLLGYLGRETEAVRAARRAVALDPAPVRYAELAMSLLYAGQDEEALEVIEEAGTSPVPEGRNASLSQVKFQVLLNSRRFDELRPVLVEAGASHEEVSSLLGTLQTGDLDDLPPEARDEVLSDPTFALLLGQPNRAAEALLETARSDPLLALQYMWMPLFDPIREHPSYLETLRELDLEGRRPQRALRRVP